MKFWDSSAVVPLILAEPATAAVQRALARDPAMAVWWGTEVECVSAIARAERDGVADAAVAQSALDRVDALAGYWSEVQSLDAVRRTARRLLRMHRLSAADSLQLAAALVASEGNPSSPEFVCLDERLSDAAQREGFPVVTDL